MRSSASAMGRGRGGLAGHGWSHALVVAVLLLPLALSSGCSGGGCAGSGMGGVDRGDHPPVLRGQGRGLLQGDLPVFYLPPPPPA
eukprot:CAMPEP_0182878204 /NCGR_PEP_ID=MMETSP0034_2-20130328/15221_1 /TAXON_ID=156128 /ORGANISM="Nephroselmis pyriformis, Strain CCMP717" /LENGTH=84 /DNA_ID=CAMNT_0025011081 /DNA_START=42 /DNA_END=293 /DNA_ORIENTATION=-